MSPADLPRHPGGPARDAPDDGTLIRWLDGELSDADARAVDEAVASDAGVRARLEHLRALSGRTGELLEALEVPPLPPRRTDSGGAGHARARTRTEARPPRWRRAAVVVLAGGVLGGAVVAAAVPGVGARFAAGLRQAAAWVTEGGGPVEPGGAGTTRVAFPVSGAVFTVTFEGTVEGGRLIVGRTPDADAQAQVVGGDPALRVDPDGLRVVGWTAAMELDVRVPATVRELRLRVGGAPERAVSLASLGGGTLRVPLIP